MNSPSRLAPIDTLRGVAILLVLLYHTGANEWRMPPYSADGILLIPHLGWRWLLVPFFHFGYVGVNCFFVISGFCIHLRAARMRAGESVRGLSPREFLWRRFLRIHPPYWIALIAFGLLLPLLARRLGQRDTVATPRDLLLHATMLHSFFKDSIFSINAAFWSLATEEQFYLVYPILLIALSRFGTGRVLVATLLLSLCFRAAVLGAVAPMPLLVDRFWAYRVWLHGFFVPRWFEWVLGCLLAEAAVSPRAPLAGKARALALLGAALFACGAACRLHEAVDKLLSDACFSSGFTAVAAAMLSRAADPARSIVHTSWIAKLQDAVQRALGALGRRAYGLYLVHHPIIDGVFLPFGTRLLRLPVATLAGLLYSRFVERPFERRSRRVGERTPEVAASAAAGDALAGP